MNPDPELIMKASTRPPKPTWRWYVFGGEELVTTFNDRRHAPSLRVRILSRIFLGSRWERL